MGKMDKLGDDEEDSKNGGNSSATQTNGTEKLSILKQMLLAGIDKRQKQDGIRRAQACAKQRVEGVTQPVDDANEKVEGVDQKVEDVNQKVEGVNQNKEGVNKNVEGEKQNTGCVKQKVEDTKLGMKHKSEDVKEKTEGVPTVQQTSPGSQKKRKKPKSSEESPKKEKKKSEAKEEPVEEEPVPKKMQKVSPAKEKEEEKEEEESDDSDSDVTDNELQYSPLSLCLETLHRNLQRKDLYGVFSFPVTDSTDPGYSEVIKTPMDFLTMSRKISDQKYSYFGEFRDDFVAMCRNAMLYYESESVEYKSAEKLLTEGLKMLSDENLTKLNTSIGVTDLNSQDSNFTVDKTFNVNTFKQETVLPSNRSSPPLLQRRREDRQVLLTASLLSAARKARETLMKKQSNQIHGGYLTENSEGKPALNILNPDTLEKEVSERNTIGYTAAGRFPRVYRRRQEMPDEKKNSKNNVIPVNYLLYGAYGSFGPSYDTSLSNLTKDESDMLVHTYGSEGHKDYISNLMTNADDDYVDGILNALGSDDDKRTTLVGQSNGTLYKIDQPKDTLQVERRSESALQTNQSDENMEITDAKMERNTETTDKLAVKDVSSNLDLTSLLTLDRVGIDVSFLKDMMMPSLVRHPSNENHVQSLEEVKCKLSQNSELLYALKQSQHDRFSQEGGGTTDIPSCEVKAATSITDNLKDLMGMVTPKDIVSSQGVKKAIGLGKSNIHGSVVQERLGEAPMTH